MGVSVGVGVGVGDVVRVGEGVKVGVGVLVGIKGTGVAVGVAERIFIISDWTVSNSSRTRIRPRDNPTLKAMIRATTARIPMKI